MTFKAMEFVLRGKKNLIKLVINARIRQLADDEGVSKSHFVIY
jgi:hypothetical protein